MDSPQSRNKTKIRLGAERWQTIMARFESSGSTQEAFCRQESLAIATFSKWRKRLKQHQTSVITEPQFIDVGSLSQDAQHLSWDIELDLGHGIILRLRRS